MKPRKVLGVFFTLLLSLGAPLYADDVQDALNQYGFGEGGSGSTVISDPHASPNQSGTKTQSPAQPQAPASPPAQQNSDVQDALDRAGFGQGGSGSTTVSDPHAGGTGGQATQIPPKPEGWKPPFPDQPFMTWEEYYLTTQNPFRPSPLGFNFRTERGSDGATAVPSTGGMTSPTTGKPIPPRPEGWVPPDYGPNMAPPSWQEFYLTTIEPFEPGGAFSGSVFDRLGSNTIGGAPAASDGPSEVLGTPSPAQAFPSTEPAKNPADPFNDRLGPGNPGFDSLGKPGEPYGGSPLGRNITVIPLQTMTSDDQLLNDPVWFDQRFVELFGTAPTQDPNEQPFN